MKNRNKRLSIRTTEQVESLLDKAMKKEEFKYFSKSDIINLVLEESLPVYAEDKQKREKK